MADIFDEVNEDLREEELKNMWKEYGPWVISGAVIAVLMTAGINVKRSLDVKKELSLTNQYFTAVQSEDVTEIQKFATENPSAHGILAQLQAARQLQAEGKDAEAQAIYQKLEADKKAQPVYQEFAKLLAISADLDKGDAATMHKDLESMIAEGASWRFSALELQALLYAREKQYADAKKSLEAIITSNEATDAMKSRARRLAQLYTSLTVTE